MASPEHQESMKALAGDIYDWLEETGGDESLQPSRQKKRKNKSIGKEIIICYISKESKRKDRIKLMPKPGRIGAGIGGSSFPAIR